VTEVSKVSAKDLGRVHFMGIGGAGMSGIARIMLMRGLLVSGCDAKESRALAGLRALGAEVTVGHAEEHIHGVDTVIYSSAVPGSNPELTAARDQGKLVLQRAAALASLMVDRTVVAVAGTHGKTTTTSMLTVAMQHCGADPSFAIGGTLSDSGANAHDGTGSVFIAEADESDGSFLLYQPNLALITNIEADHLDHYANGSEVTKAFADFLATLVGPWVGCGDDPGVQALATTERASGRQVYLYGESPECDLRLITVTSTPRGASFTPSWNGRILGEVQLRVPGRHNALNAAAALTAGLVLGMPAHELIEGLASFTGTRRRFDVRGTVREITVVDDYAHHPTEISATLQAARDVAPKARLIVAFQPHRYSRTAAFLQAFAESLAAADEVIVCEVYAAGEAPIPGASGAALAGLVPLPSDRVLFEPSLALVPERLAERARPGDLILTLGAGDITLLAPAILDAIALAK
jgi:UDP-N-acetylmuramate--alanine ligase